MKHDVIIIGAGIVGLATAYKLLKQRSNLSLLIVDKEDGVSRHQTGHNSGVIHSGLYYKPGSLKATNCVNGYHQLIAFCDENDIPYDLCGKIVVATDKREIPLLNNLLERGKSNGLKGLEKLDHVQTREYEPQVEGVAGLWVPQTGIIDFKNVSKKLAKLIIGKGGEIKFKQKVIDIKVNSGCEVTTLDNQFQAKLVINCAGLYSDKMAQKSHPKLNYKIIPFRGEYYKLKPDREHLVRNLIYPVPNPDFPFLGVHFTRMIDGGIEAGPNAVLAFKREGYHKSDIDIGELSESLLWPGFRKLAMKYWKTGIGEMYRSYSKAAFTKALQKLLPAIQPDDLVPGGSGVRAQACDKNGNLIDDFLILEQAGVINVCNAPSPAATSSLSIGDAIAAKAVEQLT